MARVTVRHSALKALALYLFSCTLIFRKMFSLMRMCDYLFQIDGVLSLQNTEASLTHAPVVSHLVSIAFCSNNLFRLFFVDCLK